MDILGWIARQEKGACFQIYLPRHTGEPAVAEQKIDSGEKLCGSESILLVEDAER